MSLPRSGPSPQRIALFSGNYNSVVDGPAKTLNRLVEWLNNKGHKVLVFAPTIDNPAFPPTGTLVSVPSFSLPGRGEYRLALGLNATTDNVFNQPDDQLISGTIRSILNDFEPDLIHLSAPDRLGFSALSYAHKNKIPVVASFHTRFDAYLQYYRASWTQPVLLKLMRNFYNRCEHVYVPSQSMLESLYKDGIGKNIHLWTRGVDRALFNPANRSQDWRHDNTIEDQDIVVLFAGRIVLEKGLDVFAETFSLASAQYPNLKALIVGDGPKRAYFEAILPDNSVFTGHLDGEHLARAYASADIFLNPSITETFGNVTLEAMASGLPSICANASGSISLIDHERTGLIGNARAQTLAPLVTTLAQDEKTRSRLGANARIKSREFEWDSIFEGLVKNYQDAVQSYLSGLP